MPNAQEPQLPEQPVANDFIEVNNLIPNANALDFDLNMIADKDLGGIDELMQAVENIEVEDPPQQVQIIKASYSSNDSWCMLRVPIWVRELFKFKSLSPRTMGNLCI